jgi:hypothetical protein
MANDGILPEETLPKPIAVVIKTDQLNFAGLPEMKVTG